MPFTKQAIPHNHTMTIETDVAPSGLASKEHYQRFLSLVESRGPSSELGYVSLNLQILECNLGQFSDTATFSALSRLLLVYEPECVTILAFLIIIFWGDRLFYREPMMKFLN